MTALPGEPTDTEVLTPMVKTLVLGLSLIAAAFIGRDYIEAAQADDEEIQTWSEFAEELRETRRAVSVTEAHLAAGLDRQQECRYATSDGEHGWSTADVRRMIACAVAKWPVEGGIAKALDVAICESGPDLMDHSRDGYTGTFQQATAYWEWRWGTGYLGGGRLAYYEPRAWDLGLADSPANPRSNVTVSIRMASSSGWSAWSCA